MSATIAAILRDVSQATGVRVEEMMSDLRTRPVSHARSISIYVAREVTLWSFARLGRAFNKDHTSVINACKRITKDMGEDAALLGQIETLIQRHRGDLVMQRAVPLDAIEIAQPIAAGSDRAAIHASVREITMLAQALVELWDVALAAETYVAHVNSHAFIADAEDARFATALGRAITEEIDTIRTPIAHPYNQENAT